MSLEYLPNELLNAILHYTTNSELFALSLVSKRLSYYARPLVRTILYRFVKITVSTRYMEDRFRESGIVHFEQRIRDNFLKTILHDATCATYIETLDLFVDPSRLRPEIKGQIVFLLRSCTNIAHLRLVRPVTGGGDVPLDFLKAIPTTLRTLELVWRPLGPAGLGLVLEKLKSLHTLDLKPSHPIEPTPLAFPKSKSVRHLSLPLDPSRLHPILPALLLSLPRLVRFTGSISSAQFLAQVPLVNLQTLRLACPLHHSTYAKCDEGGKKLTKLSEDLAATFQRTPNLRTLSVCILGWWWELNGMTLSIFHALPTSLTSLELLGTTLLPFETLSEYLATPSRAPNLKRVTVGQLQGEELGEGVRFDSDYAKLKAICKDRKISCYCTDQAPSWAR